MPSPGDRPIFAAGKGKKRKYYRTFTFLADLRKPACLQGFSRVRGLQRTTKPYEFAHLHKRDIAGERAGIFREMSETEGSVRQETFWGRSARASGEALEIRVSADAIIEVRGTDVLRHVARERLAECDTVPGISEGTQRPMWTVGDEYETWLQRAEIRARSARVARAVCVYALFAAAAALVIWYVLR